MSRNAVGVLGCLCLGWECSELLHPICKLVYQFRVPCGFKNELYVVPNLLQMCDDVEKQISKEPGFFSKPSRPQSSLILWNFTCGSAGILQWGKCTANFAKMAKH